MSQDKDAPSLARFVAALESLTDAELRALKKACSDARQIAPDFLVWLELACGWEWNRRLGSYYKLPPPEATIYRAKDEKSLAAVRAMRATFVASGSGPDVLRVFDSLIALLDRDERKH